MRLIVAEKPSVARDIAKLLAVTTKRDGALEGHDTVITWCIGHLVELNDPAAYDPRWKSWRLDLLPMLPERFELHPTRSTIAQWKIVRALLRDGRFDKVINACDAGREGELIFRRVYDLSGSRLPVDRLWVSSLTDAALRSAFASLRPARHYDSLADAAHCRAEADWLVGLNLTRAVTLRGRTGPRSELWSVGRVQTPTLALIVDRDRAIREFVSQAYFEVFATLTAETTNITSEKFTARWSYQNASRLASRALADALTLRCTAAPPPIVEAIETTRQRIAPPLFFDLTSLQRTANARWGWPAARTLSIAQALYEKHKAITYPRTDSRHLGSDLVPQLTTLVRGLTAVTALKPFASRALGAPTLSRRFIDDAKVTDHHAIVPTPKPPVESALSADEARLYDLVARRFLSAFFPDAEFDHTTVTLRVGEHKTPTVSHPPSAPPAGASGTSGPSQTVLTALAPPPDRFIARGTVRVISGWQEVTGIDETDAPRRAKPASDPDEEPTNKTLPALSVGDTLHASYRAEDKRTRPPKHHTEATLLASMESAGRDLDDDAQRAAMRDSGLGTPATRAAIIETLLNRKYIYRDTKKLVSTSKGQSLIDNLGIAALRSPELTGQWEARLARMARTEDSREKFMADIHAFVTDCVATVRRASPPLVTQTTPDETDARSPARPTPVKPPREGASRQRRAERAPASVGSATKTRCPRCKQGVMLTGHHAWGCSRWSLGCKTTVPFTLYGRTLTAAQLNSLCTTGRTRPMALTLDGRALRAALVLRLDTDPAAVTVESTAPPAPPAPAPRQRSRRSTQSRSQT